MLPYLGVKSAAEAIDFYTRAFGAQERLRLEAPGGGIMHAELMVLGTRVMLADEMPEAECLSPQTLKGTSVSVCIFVDDVDATAKTAIDAGAKLMRPIKDEFYGERIAWLKDPFGHKWALMKVLEALSPEEIKRRFLAMF